MLSKSKQSKPYQQHNVLTFQKSQTQLEHSSNFANIQQALEFLVKYYLLSKSMSNQHIKWIKAQLSQIIEFYTAFHLLQFHEEKVVDKKHIFINFFKRGNNQKVKPYDKMSLINQLVAHMYTVSCKTNISAQITKIEQQIFLSNSSAQQQSIYVPAPQNNHNNNNNNLQRQNTDDNTLPNNQLNILNQNMNLEVIDVNTLQKEGQIIDIDFLKDQKIMAQYQQNKMIRLKDNPEMVNIDCFEPMEIEQYHRKKEDIQQEFVDISSVFPSQ